MGIPEPVSDEENQPYDGTIDFTVNYTYDHQGNLTNVVSTQPDWETDSTALKLHYTYGQNGIAQSLSYTPSEAAEEVMLQFRYDDQSHLLHVDGEKPVCDFSYDDTGRLTLACYHNPEQIQQIQYTYDSEGNLISMQISSAPAHLTHSDRISFSLEKTTDFTYDKAGRLTNRKNFDADGLLTDSVVISYLPDGKKDSIWYFGQDGNLLDGFSFSYSAGQTTCIWAHSDKDGQPCTVELLYDELGNLIRRTEPSGNYVEYSYKPLHVTEEEAMLHYRSAFLRQQIDLDGVYTDLAFQYQPLSGFFLQIPYPDSPLHSTDTLRSR